MNTSPSRANFCKNRLQIGFIVLLFSIFASIPTSFAQIYEPDGLRMPGDWNAWSNTTGMGGDFDLVKNATGTLRWQTSFQFTGNTGNQEFKFVSTSFGNPWGNQWAGNADFAVNTFANVTYGPTVDPNNKIFLTQNKWYAVNFEDKAYADSRAIFMETSAEPVDIVEATQQPLMVTNQDEVSITLSLASSPSPEEKFYLRYSTTNWQTSSLVACAVNGTLATATLPAQPNDTSVMWYAFSSTLQNPQADYDLVTLKINNNGGSNYSYTVGQTIDCDQALAVLTTEPAFPLDNEATSLYFNAEMGNGGLYNYTGDVYAHTGVITNLSTSNTDWKYVKTNWGQNTPETKLTRLSANLYSLDINNIRQYYGVPASEDILKIALVFRGGEELTTGGYPEHKNADGSDILTDMYDPVLNVKISNPSDHEPLVSPNEVLAVCVDAIYNLTLSLYLDDSLLTTTADQHITFPLEPQSLAPGTYWLKAYATGVTALASDSVSIYLRGPVSVEALPAGMKPGINYTNSTSATLVLNDAAAKKQFAFAIGEFSNWLPNDANYMKRTPDGKYYWVTINNLEPNKEYAYQYYVDGNLKIADPYCDKILDPWNDRWIPAANYPDLKPYPFDKTLGTVSVLQTAQSPYTWTVTNFTPQAINQTQQDLLVYELLLRDFTEEKNLEAAIEKLDYLKNLGVNAIELMPIAEFDGNESWGYAPNFFMATDKYYGDRNTYKKFIDECHQRGMAVILDIVTNHAYGGCPMVQLYFDANAGEFGQPSSQNPWFNPQAPHPFSIGYDFNHESTATRLFIKDVLSYWLTEFKVDGFRFDLSKGLTQTYSGSDLGVWSAFDQSRINILTDYYNHIKSVNANALMICEHFAVNDEEKILANSGMLLWSAMHNNYKQLSMGWQENSDVSWAYHGNRGWNYPNLVDFMENHDEERLMFENLSYGNAAANYNIKDTLTALHHMQMASAIFMGIPGPKMVWQFGELGYDYSILFNGDRTAPKPPRWDYWNQPQRQELYRVNAAMAQLRKSDAFRFGNFTSDLTNLGKRIWIAHTSMNVVMAANMGVAAFDMAPGFQHTGSWYDYFSGETVNVSDAAGHTINLGPGAFKIFTDVALPKPFNRLNITVIDSLSGVPVNGAQIQIEESGTQYADEQGKAWFTSSLNKVSVDVTAPGFEAYTRTFNSNNTLDYNILLKRGSGFGLGDEAEKLAVNVSPNPANEKLTIVAEQNYLIKCYGLDGRLLLTHQMQNRTEKLDISNLAKGFYVLQFTHDGKMIALKVAKQ